MFIQRILVTLVLLPLGIAAIVAGGLWFGALIAVLLGLAAWEFAAIFRKGGFDPAGGFMLVALLSILIARYFSGFEADPWLFPLIAGVSMALHLVAYEQGRDEAGSDFAVTLAGILYLGVLGSFFLFMRALPNGHWWLLLTLPAVWLADSAAYLLGTRFGRHKMTPRLSPNKSWEGYLAGIVFAAVGTPLLVLLYRNWGLPAEPAFSGSYAFWLGLIMAVVPTLGDLGISMLKRQMKVKDSGNILPGHGGALDRMDSWLWAVPIAYFLIRFWFTR